MKTFLPILLLFISCGVLRSQEVPLFQINSENGLSVNHVYFTKVDTLGYMWIGTTDGLYRYNGYQLKKYDYGDGLVNTDVWSLTEDKKGRIWPHTISPELGFIENYKYKRVPVKSYRIHDNSIYHHKIIDIGDSVIIMNHAQSLPGYGDYGIFYNDTFSRYRVKEEFRNATPSFIGDSVLTFLTEKVAIVKSVNDWIKSTKSNEYNHVKNSPPNLFADLVFTSIKGDFVDKYAYFFRPKEDYIQFYNIRNNIITRISFQDTAHEPEGIVFAHEYKDHFYAFSKSIVNVYDRDLRKVKSYSFKNMLEGRDVNTAHNTFFMSDARWGKCLSNSDEGVLMSFNSEASFKKLDLDLDGYSFVNTEDDSVGYWWNEKDEVLLQVVNNNIAGSEMLHGVSGIKKVRRINDNTLLYLNVKNTIIKIGNKRYAPEELIDRYYFNKDIYDTLYTRPHKYSSLLKYAVDVLSIRPNDFYFLISGYKGVERVSINFKDRRAYFIDIEGFRYESGKYLKALNSVLLHSKNRILIINDSTQKKIPIPYDYLNKYGLRGIEDVEVDKYGNVFIKDYSQLFVYNIYTHKLKTLFANYNLEKAGINLYHDKLTIAGAFGVLTCNSSGIMQLTDVMVYPNVKNLYYSTISDMQVTKGVVVLKTDKGIYGVNAGHGNDAITSNYKFIVTNGDTIRSITNGDTLAVDQKLSNLSFDVIKPTGSGTLKFKYSVNNMPVQSTATQVLLNGLKPNTYNTVAISVADNSWVRDLYITVYVQPYPWQTDTARRIIFVLLLIALVAIVYAIIVITRYVVNKNNERRNQHRNLELKSIYSQINPHFIFNSLSTSLFFIKKNKNKEAFDHISQFSELLRSYMKSARNKYISIEEEIENINNYLQLQLSRFDNKFDYDIVVEDDINKRIVKIPSLILQPIIENALNHGIFHMTDKGVLCISFKIDKSTKDLLLIVEDNGVGRKRAKQLRSGTLKKADSYGTVLIDELVEVFNKYEKIRISIEYIDKEVPESGTIVVIRIKDYQNAT